MPFKSDAQRLQRKAGRAIVFPPLGRAISLFFKWHLTVVECRENDEMICNEALPGLKLVWAHFLFTFLPY